MRAHFAGDVVTPTGPAPDAGQHEKMEDADPSQAQAAGDMRARIDDFKQDSQNMAVLAEFIDDVLHKAEEEAAKQQQARNAKNVAQPKEKSRQSFNIPDFKNGKVVNRARGLVVRLFDAICNCANTAAAPAQRFKLRGKRAASMSSNPAGARAGGVGSIGGSVDAGGGDANIALAALDAAISKKENGKVKENASANKDCAAKKDGEKTKKMREEEPMLRRDKAAGQQPEADA